MVEKILDELASERRAALADAADNVDDLRGLLRSGSVCGPSSVARNERTHLAHARPPQVHRALTDRRMRKHQLCRKHRLPVLRYLLEILLPPCLVAHRMIRHPRCSGGYIRLESRKRSYESLVGQVAKLVRQRRHHTIPPAGGQLSRDRCFGTLLPGRRCRCEVGGAPREDGMQEEGMAMREGDEREVEIGGCASGFRCRSRALSLAACAGA